MKEVFFKDERTRVWLAPEIVRLNGLDRKDAIWDTVELFLGGLEPAENTYLHEYCKKTDRRKVGVLMAPGIEGTHEWWFLDEGRSVSVQHWVSQRDREGYGAIVLICGNAAGKTPRTSSTLIVLADRSFMLGEILLRTGTVNVSLVHPQHGDLGYTASALLKEL